MRKENNWARWAVGVLLVLGVCAQLWQYMHRESFWKDETGLARQFLKYDLGEIHKPFGENQAAPIGFVQINKLLEMGLGHKEHTFWLWGLAVGLVGMALAARLYKSWLTPLGWVVAVGLWALNPTVIMHVTQFKPYLTDALVTLVVMGAFYYYREGRRGGAWVYGLAGLGALWMSYAAVFVLAGLGLWMCAESLRAAQGLKRWRVWGINVILGAVFVALWWSNYRHIDASGGFHEFWKNDFATWPWLDIGWWGARPGEVVGYLFGQTQWLAWLMLVGLGIAQAAKTQRSLLALLLPVGLTLIASMLQLYPVYGRLEMFWLPLLIPFVALAVESLWRSAKGPVMAAVLLLVVAVPLVAPLQALPAARDPQELKQTAVLISKHAAPGQVVYVHGRAVELYRYYWQRYPLAQGVEYVEGTQAEAQNLYETLKQRFAGRHVWVVFAEPYWMPNEIGLMAAKAQERNEVLGLADFSLAGALELQL